MPVGCADRKVVLERISSSHSCLMDIGGDVTGAHSGSISTRPSSRTTGQFNVPQHIASFIDFSRIRPNSRTTFDSEYTSDLRFVY